MVEKCAGRGRRSRFLEGGGEQEKVPERPKTAQNREKRRFFDFRITSVPLGTGLFYCLAEEEVY
jgi:hypothetical protein